LKFSIADNKRILRSKLIARRNSLSKLEIRNKSKQIQEIFTASSFFEQSEVLGVYLAHGSEVKTRMIIDAGLRNMKTIAVPRVIDSGSMRFYKIDEYGTDSFFKGKFGILEPKRTGSDLSKSMDLLIVPGIAFDLHGYRLGYGMGYYDNFLRSKRKMTVIGLAFDFQIKRKQTLPHSKYDIKVDHVVTESGFQPFVLD
jgi:5-formyltetrahydrofolate cyclo-ligase